MPQTGHMVLLLHSIGGKHGISTFYLCNLDDCGADDSDHDTAVFFVNPFDLDYKGSQGEKMEVGLFTFIAVPILILITAVILGPR